MNRVQFVGLFEVWEDKKLKFLPVMMEGDYIPPQDDMKLRELLSKSVGEQYNYEVLDLIGVAVDEQVIWKD